MPDVVIWYGLNVQGVPWCVAEWDRPDNARLARQRLEDFVAAWLRQRSRYDREGED